MKINCTLYTCKRYPVNELVSDHLQPEFRKRQNYDHVIVMSHCARGVAYLGKDGANSD